MKNHDGKFMKNYERLWNISEHQTKIKRKQKKRKKFRENAEAHSGAALLRNNRGPPEIIAPLPRKSMRIIAKTNA